MKKTGKLEALKHLKVLNAKAVRSCIGLGSTNYDVSIDKDASTAYDVSQESDSSKNNDRSTKEDSSVKDDK
jgi:hypothetical protein